ncbi:MAG: helix-turn-helix domain-containing protein [Candidatus Thiodiazotropha sp. (ex Lucinoma kastoroae)]|nr:helix-turn-helix domain-containing protein [Candidatus Thiodiazotropha sp. (ex Lucinoma kastoroae)]
MNDKKNHIERAIQVIMSMATPDLAPKNRNEIAKNAGLPGSTTWRILKSLEKQGWAVHNPIEHTWFLGKPLIQLAHAHRQYAISQLDSIKEDYRSVSGEALSHA